MIVHFVTAAKWERRYFLLKTSDLLSKVSVLRRGCMVKIATKLAKICKSYNFLMHCLKEILTRGKITKRCILFLILTFFIRRFFLTQDADLSIPYSRANRRVSITVYLPNSRKSSNVHGSRLRANVHRQYYVD